MVGVMFLMLRPIFGWRTLRLWIRNGKPLESKDLKHSLLALCRALGIKPNIRVLESAQARVPLVIGCWRPVILLPLGLACHVSAAQLDAILAHELSHLKRNNFWVNLGQVVLETLFFYHPAVWWLSAKVRTEREHCCDDLVVSTFDNHQTAG